MLEAHQKVIIFLLWTLIVGHLNAQTYGLGIKANLKFASTTESTFNSSNGSTIQHDQTNFNTFPSFSFLKFSHKGSFHDFEWGEMIFDYRKNVTRYYQSGGSSHIMNGGVALDMGNTLRYSYNYNIKTRQRIQPFFGFGISPTFYRSVVEPKVSAFKTATTGISSDFEVVSSVMIDLSDRLRFSFMIPTKIWNYTFEWDRTDNPTIPSKLRKDTSENSEFFPLRFEFKAGLVYECKKREKSNVPD